MAERRPLDSAVLCCGGTGGHVYPAVAIAREILARDSAARVSFVGRPDSFESRALAREGFEMDPIEVGRLAGQGLPRRLRTLVALPSAVLRALRVLRRRRPEVVIGTGGFVSGPAMLAAVLAGRPTLVQEQNAVAGFTNRALRRLVRRVALAHAAAATPGDRRQVVTGNPVRPAFFDVPDWRAGRPLEVLVMGGSQGARRLNEATLAAAESLGDLSGRLRLVLQCGERWAAEARQRARRAAVELEVQPFLHDVPERLAAAHLVVCRAGASTVAELCAAGRPALLVPFPHAAGDHQTFNARALVAQGAAELVPDGELDGARLAERLRRAVEHPEELEIMAAAARTAARPDAAARIVDLAEQARGPSLPRAAATGVTA
jgi:UDP-N-acetylglucosamine--N-acetylmuramyl-(pentapeptide) pyrophosphoryl-undecaprenol N-acetylglucosamine transferase